MAAAAWGPVGGFIGISLHAGITTAAMRAMQWACVYVAAMLLLEVGN